MALEGLDDPRAKRPHVQVGLRRAVHQFRPHSRQRLAKPKFHRSPFGFGHGRLSARGLRSGESRIRRSRQLPPVVETPVFHPGRMEADAAHHDERGSALRAVAPVGAGVRPLHVMGIRHAVDRETRCAARHPVSRRSRRAVQDGRDRPQQLRASRRRGVGRHGRRQNRRQSWLGIYYNHISGTSVHAAEAPWTGTVQLFNGRIDDPSGR